MSDALPFFERILRVTHSHVAHRSSPPTRYEPWTLTKADSSAYRQYVGYRIVNVDTDQVTYLYLVPTFGEYPHVSIYMGATGDPEHDEMLDAIEIHWDI